MYYNGSLIFFQGCQPFERWATIILNTLIPLLQDTAPESIYILLLRYYGFLFRHDTFLLIPPMPHLELNIGQRSAILHYLSRAARLEE